MGIDLVKSGNVFLPEVPSTIKDPAVIDYLRSLRGALSNQVQGLFSNDLLLADALNQGTSGTFTISSGGSIIVTSGVVVTVTS